jgi:transcriptional regulator with XRE-family HTH domain
MEAADLASVVGANVRRIRSEAGATLEEVAKAARRQGLAGWGGGRVSDLEHGRVSPTLPTLVAVSLALAEVRKSPLTLAELLRHDGPVAITGSLAIRAAALARFVDGEPVRLTKRDVPDLPGLDAGELAAGLAQWAGIAEQLPARLAEVSTEEVLSVQGRSGEAERRIANWLGVAPLTIAAASAYLYRGRTASEERDRRAGGGVTAQKRGRIAREIRAEIKAVLDGDH